MAGGEGGSCLILSAVPQDKLREGKPTAGSLLPTTLLRHYCRLGWGVSSKVTCLRKAEAATKRQEQRPGCPFAPGQMAADAELPGPVALNQVEQGPRKRKVQIIERETEKVLLDLAMVGPWVAKPRIAESQRAW